MKTCRKCKTNKADFEFHKSRNTWDGRQSNCIACRKTYAQLHPESRRKAVKKWISNNGGRVKANRRKRTLAAYGISEEQFGNLQVKQNLKCAICHETFSCRPHVDHDHARGRIRGLLCSQCNVGLGMFKDSKKFLSNAISYLILNEL